MRRSGRKRRVFGPTLLGVILTLSIPTVSEACACGCNVFSVGARWMMATSSGYKLSLMYDYMNQTRNWSGWNVAPDALNRDRVIRSNFTTLGFQYMASREWGMTVEVPVWDRYFETTTEDGTIATADHRSIADVRAMATYTGLSEDMSTGVLFGLKLPTGPAHQPLLERDTQIGTGTTDLLLGGYQMGQEAGWGWFGQVLWQHALNSRDEYRPGDSFDVNIGFHYDAFMQDYHVAPMLQVVGSFRGIDEGSSSDPENTGYKRLYISPGLEANLSSNVTLYGDLRIPVITEVRGNQLVAPSLLNITLSIGI